MGSTPDWYKPVKEVAMSACGQCGGEGHNRRSCKKVTDGVAPEAAPDCDPFVVTRSDVAIAFVVKDQESIARNARLVSGDFDDETKEAIAWYMETNYPGWAKRKAESMQKKRLDPDDEDA
jgi:hypothetical protein